MTIDTNDISTMWMVQSQCTATEPELISALGTTRSVHRATRRHRIQRRDAATAAAIVSTSAADAVHAAARAQATGLRRRRGSLTRDPRTQTWGRPTRDRVGGAASLDRVLERANVIDTAVFSPSPESLSVG
jgi:hypothetical protein